MTLKQITGYLILIAGIIASLFDVWDMLHGYSISQFMTGIFYQHPTVTFMIGFICGHWVGSFIYKSQ